MDNAEFVITETGQLEEFPVDAKIRLLPVCNYLGLLVSVVHEFLVNTCDECIYDDEYGELPWGINYWINRKTYDKICTKFKHFIHKKNYILFLDEDFIGKDKKQLEKNIDKEAFDAFFESAKQKYSFLQDDPNQNVSYLLDNVIPHSWFCDNEHYLDIIESIHQLLPFFIYRTPFFCGDGRADVRAICRYFRYNLNVFEFNSELYKKYPFGYGFYLKRSMYPSCYITDYGLDSIDYGYVLSPIITELEWYVLHEREVKIKEEEIRAKYPQLLNYCKGKGLSYADIVNNSLCYDEWGKASDFSGNSSVYGYIHQPKNDYVELKYKEMALVRVPAQTVIVQGSDYIPEFCWAIGEEKDGTKRKVSLLQIEKKWPNLVQRRNCLSGSGEEIVVSTPFYAIILGTLYNLRPWTKVINALGQKSRKKEERNVIIEEDYNFYSEQDAYDDARDAFGDDSAFYDWYD